MPRGQSRFWWSAQSSRCHVKTLFYHEVSDHVELNVREILWSWARQASVLPPPPLLFLLCQLILCLPDHLQETSYGALYMRYKKATSSSGILWILWGSCRLDGRNLEPRANLNFPTSWLFSHLWGILFTCEGWEGRERGGTLVSDKPALGDLARETSCKSKYMAKGENIAKGSKYGKMKIIHPSSWCGVRRLVGGDSASSRTRFFRCWVGRLFSMFSSEHVNVRQGGTKCWSVAATLHKNSFGRKSWPPTYAILSRNKLCRELRTLIVWFSWPPTYAVLSRNCLCRELRT